MNNNFLRSDRLLENLRPHPRLIVDDARLAEIRALVDGDDFAAAAKRDAVAIVEEWSRSARKEPPVQPGLSYTNKTLALLTACGLVWRLNRDPEALACARARLVEICSAPAWSRDNFLAIGELGYALAIGYDWLRDDLSAADRELVRRYILDAILGQGIAAYDQGDWWIDTPINWNHECNGGLIIAALAIADTDPDIARSVIPRAARWLDHALAGYDPDGGWDEGAGYWGRATIYSVYALAALETGLGTDFGLSERHGLAETARFYLSAVGPTGLLACYADCTDDRRQRNLVPALLWLAHRYQRPEYAQCEIDYANASGPIASYLLWYRPIREAPALALDHRFRAPGTFVSMRSSWNDPQALFAWIKGGNNMVNHGHLDQGNFELDALGQRWARDLGADAYSLPGYFDRLPGGRRWTYFRNSSASHSVPQLDGAGQQPTAIAHITGFLADSENPRAVVDLSEAYAPAAETARRGLMLVKRRAMLVQDEFVLAKARHFTWAMTTDAAIAATGTKATLTLGGQRLLATILEPAGAVFTQESAERSPPENTNAGVRRLLIAVPAAHGQFRVAVLLSPCWPDGIADAPPAIVPLGRWF